jgi:O-antigen/teichoic acid export membrane protein
MNAPLRRDLAVMLAAQVWSKVTDFLLASGLAHLLVAPELGMLFWSISFARAFNVVAGLNIGPLIVRRIARAPDRAGEQVAGLWGLRLITAAPFLIIVLGAGTRRPELWPALIPVAIYVLLEDVTWAMASTLIVRGRTAHYALLLGAAQTTSLALCLGAAWAIGGWLAVSVGLLGRSALACFAAWWLADRPRPALPPGLLTGVGPFFWSALFSTTADQIDTLVVGLYAPWEDVGAWGLVLRVVLAASFLPQLVSQVLYPRQASQRDDAQMLRAIAGLLGVGVLAGLSMAVLAPYAAPVLFGAHGDVVARTLWQISGLLPLNYLCMLLVTTLQARDGEWATLRALLIADALGLAVSLTLIPSLGLGGAVAGRYVAASVQIVLVSLRLWRSSREP